MRFRIQMTPILDSESSDGSLFHHPGIYRLQLGGEKIDKKTVAYARIQSVFN